MNNPNSSGTPKTLGIEDCISGPSDQALNTFQLSSIDAAEIEKIKQEYQKVTISALTICCTCD